MCRAPGIHHPSEHRGSLPWRNVGVEFQSRVLLVVRVVLQVCSMPSDAMNARGAYIFYLGRQQRARGMPG